MKGFKKLVSLLAVAAITVLLPGANTLQASAANPTTYYVKFDTDKGEWRMQIGEWNKELEGRETYYLNQGSEAAKDGDILVVMDMDTVKNDDDEDDEITKSASGSITVNAHLSNLTINRTGAVIYTGGVDECHVLGDSYAAINGDVTNAYVYDNAKCTFNNNVTNLRLIASVKNDVETSVSVAGTVAYASVSNTGGVIREYFNFVKGSFYYDFASGLMTDPSQYSTNGSTPAAQTQAPAQTQSSAQNNTAASSGASGEYDDVPKTGENNVLFMILLAISAMSFAGCMALNLRKAKVKEK